jgi:hypothetical protein
MLGAQRHDGRRPLCYSISTTLTPTLADMCLSTLYPHPQSAQSPDALCSTAFSRTVRRACGVHAKRGKNRTKSEEQGLVSFLVMGISMLFQRQAGGRCIGNL